MSPAVITAPREAQATEPRFEKTAEAPAMRPEPQLEPAPFAPSWLPEFAPLR